MKGWLEDIPFADHNAMLDPSCSDLTGPARWSWLGYLDWDKRGPPGGARPEPAQAEPVRRRFVVRTLGASITSTAPWQVLRGLRALDYDMSEKLGPAGPGTGSPPARTTTAGGAKAATPTTTRRSRGKGPSHREPDLVGVDGPDRGGRTWIPPPCRRACSTSSTPRNADGSWSEDEITGTGFPKVFYLKYDMYRNNFPLLALATYENARHGVFRPGHMQLKPAARNKYYPKLRKLAPQLATVVAGIFSTADSQAS